MPMKIWKYYKNLDSSFSSCPSGVILYGLPGTGKTLTAKAIANGSVEKKLLRKIILTFVFVFLEAGATFINVKASNLTDKYFGETDKLVTALFKIARKLAPSVVFIDEIETLLKKRFL